MIPDNPLARAARRRRFRIAASDVALVIAATASGLLVGAVIADWHLITHVWGIR